MFNKKELIQWIEENVAEESEIFLNGEKNEYGVQDITVFDKPHDKKFYAWYFGP